MKLTYQRMFDYEDLMEKHPHLIKLEIMDYNLRIFKMPMIFKKTVSYVLKHHKLGYSDLGGMKKLKEEIYIYESLLNGGLETKQYSVFVGNGVCEILYTVIKAILSLPENATRKEVILFTPGYSLFESVVKVLGGQVKWVHGERKNDFVPTIEDINNSITKNTSTIIFANPHNPTTVSYPESFLKNLVHLSREHNLFLVSDEIYAEMVRPPHKHISTASLNNGFSNLVKVFGLSKDRPGMTGLRIGYCITDSKLTKSIKDEYLTRNFTINILSEYLLLTDLALRNKKLSGKINPILELFPKKDIDDYYHTIQENYTKIFNYQDRLCSILDNNKKIVDYITPHGCNMIFFKYYKNLPPDEFFNEFLKKGIGIYAGDAFHVNEKVDGSWTRICVTRNLSHLLNAISKIN